MRIVCSLSLIVLLGAPGAVAAAASADTDPLSARIDETAYFATAESEQQQRKALIAAIDAFAAQPAPAIAQLDDYMGRADALLERGRRHEAYLHLLAARDIEDSLSDTAQSATDNAVGRLRRAVDASLRKLAQQRALGAGQAPSRYAYLLQQAQRRAPHELPAEQDAIVDALADPAASTYWSLYQQIRRTTPAAKIATANGERDANRDADLLAGDRQRSVRQAAWQQRWDGYAARGDVYATLLLGTVRLTDASARLHHFATAPDAAYAGRGFDRSDVERTLSAVKAGAAHYRQYQRMRAAHVQAVQHLDSAAPWDMKLPEPGLALPQFTLAQARAAAVAAVQPLGSDYADHFRALLDPAQRRLDVAGTQGHRVDDGFSLSAQGVPSGLFVGRYAPSIEGPRVLIHEGGHAVHRQLMSERGISPFYRNGPSWLFESYAILNEMLLYDHLYRSSGEPRAKAYYLQALIDDLAFQIFTSAEETELEQAIYDGAIAGTLRNAGDFDALTASIWGQYGDWDARYPQSQHAWMGKRLLYQDPLYLVNYLYAGLLASSLYDQASTASPGFQTRYHALLSDGFAAPPDALLATFFGHPVTPQQLMAQAMDVFDARVRELDALYATLPPAGRIAGDMERGDDRAGAQPAPAQ
ncbi:M3 family metallopeptidase [Xanthomonas campestris pv. phormiicola]|nr:M3 family metallopeptidase [Xanthomonas campestris pv. phormiicola]UYC16149.1 M3 family metallopeptidase [Xanthomonas campestris pv. phormiicola]